MSASSYPITTSSSTRAVAPCEFCSPLLSSERVVHTERSWNVLYAQNPVREGHFVIAPIRHVASHTELSTEEMAGLQEVVKNCSVAAAKFYGQMEKPYLLLSETSQEKPHHHHHFIPASSRISSGFLLQRLYDPTTPVLSAEEMAGAVERSKGCFQEVMHAAVIEEQRNFLDGLIAQSPLMKFAVQWRLEALAETTGRNSALEGSIETIRALPFVGSSTLPEDSQAFYGELLQVGLRLQGSGSTREVPTQEHRDRYTYITPYQFNQVVLSDGTLMNGSRIKFPQEGQPYSSAATACFAFSAPMPGFVLETLKMYAQEGSKCVVNLTDFEESHQGYSVVKAHRYLPENAGDEVQGDGYRIKAIAVCHTQLSDTLTLERKLCEYEVDGQTHQITQFHLQGWKDFTAGEPIPTAQFIQRVIGFERETPGAGNSFVHCSAGVGRTGVIVAGMQIYKEIEQGITPDIDKIAMQMRSQRIGLGGSVGQYEMLWELKKIFEQWRSMAS